MTKAIKNYAHVMKNNTPTNNVLRAFRELTTNIQNEISKEKNLGIHIAPINGFSHIGGAIYAHTLAYRLVLRDIETGTCIENNEEWESYADGFVLGYSEMWDLHAGKYANENIQAVLDRVNPSIYGKHRLEIFPRVFINKQYKLNGSHSYGYEVGRHYCAWIIILENQRTFEKFFKPKKKNPQKHPKRLVADKVGEAYFNGTWSEILNRHKNIESRAFPELCKVAECSLDSVKRLIPIFNNHRNYEGSPKYSKELIQRIVQRCSPNKKV